MAVATGSDAQFVVGGDFPVNRLGFGAMHLTGTGVWGEPKDRDGAIRLVRRAAELGVNLIDTADAYGPEVSERIIAEALHPYPQNLLIATKGGFTRPRQQWVPDGRPERLKAACDASLRRLKLERIDLYQLHVPDPRIPIEESIGALAELRAKGKIRHVGVSNVTSDQLERARAIVPIVSVQNNYNVRDRASDPIVDYCERNGLGFIPFFPLGYGNLSRDHGQLREVGQRYNATPSQIALAWLLKRSPSMLPIPGTSSIAHLEENTAAAAIDLSDEDFRALSNQRR